MQSFSDKDMLIVNKFKISIPWNYDLIYEQLLNVIDAWKKHTCVNVAAALNRVERMHQNMSLHAYKVRF